MESRIKKFTASLFSPVDAASLGVFRIMLGLLMAYELLTHKSRYLELLDSKFMFKYDFFHWVVPFSHDPAVISVFLYCLLAAHLLLAAGIFYRGAALVSFLGYAYLFLWDTSNYNNHYYLYILLLLFFVFIDGARSFSAAHFFRKPESSEVPYWQLFIFRLQLLIVYFYGGISKINADWLRGFPMKLWLEAKSGSAPFLTFPGIDFMAYFLSYGGLVFDLSVGFMLFSRKTRMYALPLVIFFNVTNHYLWDIGSFPWFMICATTLFFDADWPRKIFGGKKEKPAMAKKAKASPLLPLQQLTLALLGVYFLFQFLFPLRHFLFKGDPGWTGEGHSFSWRMMVVDNFSKARMKVMFPESGVEHFVRFEKYMNERQYVTAMRTPEKFLQFAHFIRDELVRENVSHDPVVHLNVMRRLNGRPYFPLVDTTANLATVNYSPFRHCDWLVLYDKEVLGPPSDVPQPK